MDRPADLHTHTTHSDGTLTPADLVREAVARGLGAIAVTDHDTVAGIAGATAAAGDEIEVVPGVELSSSAAGRELHLLGYFVDTRHPAFLDRLRELASGRDERIARIVARLSELGLPISLDRVRELAGTGSIGRPHVARVMIESGHVGSVGEAFDRYIGMGQSAFVPRARFTPEEAIALVRLASGVPVLAHPWTTGDPEGVVERLLPAGLLGIEVDYGEYDHERREGLRAIAGRHGLIATGGSDYHGPGFRAGRDLGIPPVPLTVVNRLRTAASALQTTDQTSSRT